MKRYYAEQFCNLTLGDGKDYGVEMEEKVKDFLFACRRSVDNSRYQKDTWEEYDISENERQEILIQDMDGFRRYLIENVSKKDSRKKEEFKKEFLNRDTKAFFLNLIQTQGAWRGVINDLYLALLAMEEKQYDIRENLDEEEIDRVKYYVRNTQKGKSNLTIPFSDAIEDVNNPIVGFGSEIKCLWACSSKFRNLLQWVEYKSNKYSLTNYLSCEFDILSEDEENNLILNKMIGGNIIWMYYKSLYPILVGLEAKHAGLLKKLIAQVMQCVSNDMCCEVIRFIGNEMSAIKNASEIYKRNRIKLYIEYMKELLPQVNQQYNQLLEIVARGIQKGWGKEELTEWTLLHKHMNDVQTQNQLKYREILVDDDSEHMRLVIQEVMKACHDRYIKERN